MTQMCRSGVSAARAPSGEKIRFRHLNTRLPPIREIAVTVDLRDTLLLFTADHSFDLRVRGGGPGEPILETGTGEKQELAFVRVDNRHTGEEVIVLAQGPGAERVKGFFPNTEIFRIVMAAYGWREDK